MTIFFLNVCLYKIHSNNFEWEHTVSHFIEIKNNEQLQKI